MPSFPRLWPNWRRIPASERWRYASQSSPPRIVLPEQWSPLLLDFCAVISAEMTNEWRMLIELATTLFAQ